jgi:hypothetical protein
MEGACGAPRVRFESLGQREREKAARTGAQKCDPTHPTLQLFLYYVSQDIPIDLERQGAMDCGISFGFALPIDMLQPPVPFESDGLGVVGRGHDGDERRQGLGK